MPKKAFTLVEIIIVTIVVALLSTLLLRTYIVMTRIAFRVEQEKIVTENVVFVSQVIQNIIDTYRIDFDRYVTDFGSDYLINNKWITDTLYLINDSWSIALFGSWSCLSVVGTGLSDCVFVLQNNWWDTILTEDVFITKPFFKIVPYASEEAFLDNPSLCPFSYYACLHHPWFWLWVTFFSPYRQDTWETDIIHPLQLFFTAVRS